MAPEDKYAEVGPAMSVEYTTPRTSEVKSAVCVPPLARLT